MQNAVLTWDMYFSMKDLHLKTQGTVLILSQCYLYRMINMGGMKTETAILGGGCFWCTEAIYKNIRGIMAVTSGYSGGQKENPSYEEVCSGRTGHAEVIKLEFNPQLISYREVLEIFFATHDPTTLNRQGADKGDVISWTMM